MSILKHKQYKFYLNVADAALADAYPGDRGYFRNSPTPGWFDLFEDYGNPAINDDCLRGKGIALYWKRSGTGDATPGITDLIPRSYAAGESYKASEMVRVADKLFFSNVVHIASAADVADLSKLTEISGSTEALTMPAIGEPGTPAASALSVSGVAYSAVAEKDLASAIITLLYPATTPDPIVPTLTASTIKDTVEVGESIQLPISWVWTLGSSDSKVGNLSMTYAGNTDPDITLTPHAPAVELFAAEGVNQYVLTQGYAAGPVPNDSYGNPNPAKQLPAGTANATVTINGAWPSYGMGVPVDSDSIVFDETTNIDRRDKIALVCGTKTLALTTSFGAGVIPANKDIFFAVPGSFNTVTVTYVNFNTPVGEIVTNNYVVADIRGVDSKPYTIVRLMGAALDTNYDTIVLS